MAEKYKKKALCASVYNAVNLPAREPERPRGRHARLHTC